MHMTGHLIVLKTDEDGPVYIYPKSITDARPGLTSRDQKGYQLQGAHGARFKLTMAEWEQVKPLLVADESDLHAALNEAIREGIALAKKLTQAEQRIRDLEAGTVQPSKQWYVDPEALSKARQAVRDAQQWYDDAGESPAHFGEVSEAIESYYDKASSFFDLYDEAVKPASKPGSELQTIAKADVEDAIRRADALDDQGGHVKPGSGFIGEVRSSNDDTSSAAPSVPDNGRIPGLSWSVTHVRRGSFYSSDRPMWTLVSDKGTANVFDHADPLRDHKGMLEKAGYLAFFQTMKHGETVSWTQHPIAIGATSSGKFWDVVAIGRRDPDATPDTPVDKLTPAQLAVCKEAAEIIDRGDVVVFDCETTGLDEDDEVVEIAGFLLDPTHPDPHFSTLIKPTDMALLTRPGKKGKSAFDIHGIGEEMLKDAPKMDDPSVLNLLSEFMDKKAWAAFNIDFDERLLYQGLDAAGIHDGFPEGRKNFCIQQMMNRYLGREYVSLDDACKALGIARSTRHRAEADASDALDVLKALAAKVPAENTQDIPF
jgi:DNA polymerase III epsilon subunit-like protein